MGFLLVRFGSTSGNPNSAAGCFGLLNGWWCFGVSCLFAGFCWLVGFCLFVGFGGLFVLIAEHCFLL